MGATSPSGLELTMAVPGLSSSSGSEGFGCNGNGNGSNMRDLDMNQPASGGEEEEFPMGSVEEDEEERGPGAGVPHRPKKLRLSKEQSRLLEESFRLNHTLTPKQKEALAVKLKLRPRQVEVWFQNRRARTKLKQTEMECEYLRRCFGSLTEENRLLQREVEELRAMRVAPPTVLSPHTRQSLPASALTMCPRCERITAATGALVARNARPLAASPFHSGCPSAAF
ncbi:homeobox-leucine zipper protein HOX3-like [Phragmites australis]|uniref:homeobox-leucine zipper protein HOX3-like n=1 Tax=Phragmites australis TaxID=29695 RepID=UPI002D79EA40|nr:homeobox-leucine zipper protein HOX3-like [Phragmites australis]